jgi:hypothetical protein
MRLRPMKAPMSLAFETVLVVVTGVSRAREENSSGPTCYSTKIGFQVERIGARSTQPYCYRCSLPRSRAE